MFSAQNILDEDKVIKPLVWEQILERRKAIPSKGSLIEASKAHFKAQGFKKRNNSWFKFSDSLVACFNVQGSQFNKDYYYINVGIVVLGVDEKPQLGLGSWHIQDRVSVEDKTVNDMLSEVDAWLEKCFSMDYMEALLKMDHTQRFKEALVIMPKALDFLEKHNG